MKNILTLIYVCICVYMYVCIKRKRGIVNTYDGVYMRYLRGGKMLKSHVGTISKLQ